MLYICIILHILAMLFYYSPISLTGWWSDVIFLYTTILLLLLTYKKIKLRIVKVLVILSCALNGVFAGFNTFVSAPVHLIPKGKFADRDTYAYYTMRGNAGLVSKCHGQIHLCKQITWLPFLEIATDYIACDIMGYDCWLEDC